jgi:hypothetical protein
MTHFSDWKEDCNPRAIDMSTDSHKPELGDHVGSVQDQATGEGKRDALAERIAAGFRDRKKVAEERRMQERDYLRRNSERALLRYHKLRGELKPEFSERSEPRIKEIDAAYEALILPMRTKLRKHHLNQISSVPPQTN